MTSDFHNNQGVICCLEIFIVQGAGRSLRIVTLSTAGEYEVGAAGKMGNKQPCLQIILLKNGVAGIPASIGFVLHKLLLARVLK